MKKPGFFVAGAPKAATTSIHYYLSQHPDIFMSDLKEPHYFCKDFTQDNLTHGLKQLPLIQNDDEYLRNFSRANSESVLGEASTTYFYSSVAAQEIHSFNPDSKILIVLREPTDLIISWYRYLKFYSHEPCETFEQALAAEASRQQGKNIPSTVFFRSFLYYREIAKLDIHLKRYFNLFPRDNLLVLCFDDFKTDTPTELVKICEFLGVDPSFSFDTTQQKNIRKGVQRQSFKRFVDKYTFWIQRRLLPYKEGRFCQFLLRQYRKVFISESIDQLSEEQEAELKKEFFGHVENAGKLINRDLVKLWGYDKLPS